MNWQSPFFFVLPLLWFFSHWGFLLPSLMIGSWFIQTQAREKEPKGHYAGWLFKFKIQRGGNFLWGDFVSYDLFFCDFSKELPRIKANENLRICILCSKHGPLEPSGVSAMVCIYVGEPFWISGGRTRREEGRGEKKEIYWMSSCFCCHTRFCL